jgi:hypothetical protein
MKMRSKLVGILIAAVLLLLLVPVAAFFLVQSSGFVNGLSSLLENRTGYHVHVESISFNRHLHAEVNGLEIRSIKKDGLFLTCSTAEIKGKVASSFKVEIEKILLTHPKFVFHLQKSTEETNLFVALANVPPVRFLVVHDGRLEIKADKDSYIVPGIHLTVKDFSPKKGGGLAFEGRVNVTAPAYALAGAFSGTFIMGRFTPTPSGAGAIKVSLNTASFGSTSLQKLVGGSDVRINGDTLSFDHLNMGIDKISSGKGSKEVTIKDIRLHTNLSYDQKSSRFSLTSLEGSGLGLGSIKGLCNGFIKPLSWSALIKASAIDLPSVFAMARPLLPEEYEKWTFKGTGALAVQTDGHMGEALSWRAAIVLDLDEGGFASADNLKAGERITGQIQLKLSSPEKEEKVKFDTTVWVGNGELLWGKYYRDFKGEYLTITSQGGFMLSPFLLSCTGTADVFQTGRYTFSGDLSPGTSLISLEGSNLSHERLFTILAKGYVAQNYPETGDLTFGGVSDIHLSTTMEGKTISVSGHVSIREASLAAPSMGISLSDLQLSLPLDLQYPEPTVSTHLGTDQGLLGLGRLEVAGLQIKDLHVPLLLSGNTFLVPSQIEVPLFDGAARLTHLQADHLLSSEMRLDAGLYVEKLDLGVVTEIFSPVKLNGTVNISLPSIEYYDGGWKTKGEIGAHVFGGQIEISHIFANNLFSRGRTLGCDIAFEDLDLEAMTDKIEVGKITGVVRGFAKDLTFEYGQPSRFVLTLETDTTKKVPRQISVDAIKNLSIVSTGSSAISAILSSGINRFFKEYPYSRIGIACALENDVFSLRGTIHEGGKEYLVKRALFRGIDVINQNPENSISFKDMQERIGRVFRPRQESKSMFSLQETC